MQPNNLPPHAQLMQFILGKWISKPIYVVAELRIADLLAKLDVSDRLYFYAFF